MTEYRYRAFISYAHADKRWGDWLHRKLETWRSPKKLVGRETAAGPAPARLTPIFRDREELSAAHSLSDEIEAALSDSRYLIVLCSPKAARSKWVNQEILRFKQLHGEGRVLAAIIAGEPGDAETECFPPALQFRIGDDGVLTEERAEPIAADFRKGKDGRRAGLQKLIAGLLGVRLDEIVEREAQRRAARMRVAVGALSALVLAFAGIALEAMRQRDAARVAEARAVTARAAAEEQIEFMLTDLRTDLEAVGRLDILDSVGERALAYYAARDLRSASPDELGRRARAQLLIGEMDNRRGDLDAALEAYEAAATTTGEQLARDPDNPDRIFDHSQSLFWVGYIAWQRGDSAEAKEQFTEYYELAQRLVAIDPENDDWRLELNYAYSNLGTLALEQGSAEEAEQWFRKSLEIALDLVAKEPDAIDRVLTAGQAFAWLGESLTQQIRNHEARALRQQEIVLYEKALEGNPSHAGILEKKLIAHRAAGVSALSINNLGQALADVQTASEIAERLLATDRSNVQWLEFSALAEVQRGEILFHVGELEGAERALLSAIDTGERLLASNPDVQIWTVNFSVRPKWLAARLYRSNNDTERSIRYASGAYSAAQALIQPSSTEVWTVWGYCSSLSLGLELGLHAEKDWTHIVDLLAPLESKLPAPSAIILARSYTALGQDELARPIVSRLYSAGYRHPDFLSLLDAHPGLRPT